MEARYIPKSLKWNDRTSFVLIMEFYYCFHPSLKPFRLQEKEHPLLADYLISVHLEFKNVDESGLEKEKTEKANCCTVQEKSMRKRLRRAPP